MFAVVEHPGTGVPGAVQLVFMCRPGLPTAITTPLGVPEVAWLEGIPEPSSWVPLAITTPWWYWGRYDWKGFQDLSSGSSSYLRSFLLAPSGEVNNLSYLGFSVISSLVLKVYE